MLANTFEPGFKIEIKFEINHTSILDRPTLIFLLFIGKKVIENLRWVSTTSLTDT